MDDDIEIETTMAQVAEDLKTLRQRIGETDVPADQVWFRNLLCGILNCAATDYRTVEIGVKKLVELAAWGCRNLLELEVLTEFALTSEENAIALQNDRVCGWDGVGAGMYCSAGLDALVYAVASGRIYRACAEQMSAAGISRQVASRQLF